MSHETDLRQSFGINCENEPVTSTTNTSQTLVLNTTLNTAAISDQEELEQTTSTNDERTNSSEEAPEPEGHTNKSFSRENCRKRKRNVDTWAKNIKSKNYNTGIEYKHKGVTESRSVLGQCPKTCKKKCFNTIPLTEQATIHNAFWATGEKVRRRDWICNHVTREEKKRSTTQGDSRRKYTNAYCLPKDGKNLAVCKQFFLKTLGISEEMVHYNLARRTCGTVEKSPTQRDTAKKIPVEAKTLVMEHIQSFPQIESHYTRSDTKRNYLEPGLNIREMYRLYKKTCATTQNVPVSEDYYRRVFNENFNLGFHVPSKDQCDTCTAFEANEMSEEDASVKEAHLRRKQKARDEKKQDKVKESGKICAVFDLQQVMVSPKLNVGAAYYRRKLSVYNFTVLELQTEQGHCFTWHEGEGNRGANEIATCLWKWLEKMEQAEYSHIVLYSDTCGGQTRNRIMCTALLSFLAQATHIKLIEQKFFESGHSQSECDSMHSCIERQFKSKKIHIPSDYQACMIDANKKLSYTVKELTHKDFKDFDKLNRNCVKGLAFQGIISVHHIRYERELAGLVTVAFSDEIGKELSCKPYFKRGRNIDWKNVEIPAAYSACLPITTSKKSDLLALCRFLPADCRPFYENLQTL